MNAEKFGSIGIMDRAGRIIFGLVWVSFAVFGMGTDLNVFVFFWVPWFTGIYSIMSCVTAYCPIYAVLKVSSWNCKSKNTVCPAGYLNVAPTTALIQKPLVPNYATKYAKADRLPRQTASHLQKIKPGFTERCQTCGTRLMLESRCREWIVWVTKELSGRKSWTSVKRL